jgi:hypothetical protein
LADETAFEPRLRASSDVVVETTETTEPVEASEQRLLDLVRR